jgi:hypothetical protein
VDREVSWERLGGKEVGLAKDQGIIHPLADKAAVMDVFM